MEVGERKYAADKETLDKVYDMLSTDPVWGFVEHMDVKSPTERITPIGLNKNYKNVTRNGSTGVVSLNDWADHPVIKANKPYMVKSDGTPDYLLSEEDYTKKSDGVTDSDVANVNYDGSAFSWFPKIYKYEAMRGNDRTVLFSMSARDGFFPNGFIDQVGHELEGVWLPMFYGSVVTEATPQRMVSLSGLETSYDVTTEFQYTAIQNFSTRGVFLGGPIVETIIDFLMMMAGSTNLQAVYGRGNTNGYSSGTKPTYGMKENAVIGGGQFYGTDDGGSLNKIFHSIVLGSYQQFMRDPYEIVVKGRVRTARNYIYDPTGLTYEDTGINVPALNPARTEYPLRYQTVRWYGSIPAIEFNGGSTETGSCDGLHRHTVQNAVTAVTIRFGSCGRGLIAGPRYRDWSYLADGSEWDIGAAILLLPPAGVTV